jgi:hypothetical protein
MCHEHPRYHSCSHQSVRWHYCPSALIDLETCYQAPCPNITFAASQSRTNSENATMGVARAAATLRTVANCAHPLAGQLTPERVRKVLLPPLEAHGVDRLRRLMGKDMVTFCDNIGQYGLVDYQNGVWEERIIASKCDRSRCIKCALLTTCCQFWRSALIL